ncbi:tetratricopeptide repeat protein [bacterium]|nr:tetratricopeptide repeat protein [bacterium]
MKKHTWIIFSLAISVFIFKPACAEQVTPSNVLDYMIQQVDAAADGSDMHVFDYIRGMAYFRALQYENALNSFKKTLEADPTNPNFLGMIANCYYHLNRYEDAVEWFHKTLAADPKYPKGYLRLGLSLERLNKPDDALEAFQTCYKEAPDEMSSLYYAAKLLYDKDELDEASKLVESLRSKTDIFSEPIYLQAQIARKKGDMDAAKAFMAEFQAKRKEENAAFDETPRMSDDVSARRAAVSTHFDLAQLLFELKKNKEALAQLDNAISLAPDDMDARLTAVNLAVERKQDGFVEKQLRWLTKQEPDNGQYAFRLGILLGTRKQFEESEQYLERASNLMPNDADVLRGLVECMIQLKRSPKLIVSLCQDAAEIDHSAISYDLLSRVYYMTGHLDESISAMQNAIKADPQNSLYKKRYQALLARRNQ